MTPRRTISIDRPGAIWAYKLGHFGIDNPFDPDTPHFLYWQMGKVGWKFEFNG